MKKCVLVLMVVLAAGAGSAQAQELIQGGSFEYWPNVFELKIFLNVGDWIPGPTAVEGDWEVDLIAEAGFGVVALPDGWTASPVSDGFWNMHIADGGRVAGIRQFITTSPGKTYDLSFWHEDFGHDQDAQIRVQIGDAGGTGTEYLDQVFNTTPPVYQTASFTATAANSVIRFENVEFGNTIDEVSVLEQRPIVAQITETDGGTEVREGADTDTYEIEMLASPPADADVRVEPATGYETDLILTPDPSTHVFTSANWQTPITITVSAPDDGLVDGDEVVDLVHGLVWDAAASVTDPNFVINNITNAVVSVTVKDSFGVKIDPTTVNVAEEGETSDTYTVELLSQPSISVDVLINPDAEADVDKTSVSFDSGNWDTPQTVTVTAIDDAVGQATDVYQATIAHTVDAGLSWAESWSDDFENGDPNFPVKWVDLTGGLANETGGTLFVEDIFAYPADVDLPAIYRLRATINDDASWHLSLRGDPNALTSPGLETGLVMEFCCNPDLRLFNATGGGWVELGGADLPQGLNAGDYSLTVTDTGASVAITMEEVGNAANALAFTINGLAGIGDGSKLLVGGWAGWGIPSVTLKDIALDEPVGDPGEITNWTSLVLDDVTVNIEDNDCSAARSATLVGDIDGDCFVGLVDFATGVAANWLGCSLPNNIPCN
jgi:hypothetical protein